MQELLIVALVAAFVMVLRRAAQVVAMTRVDDTFRRDGAALADAAAEVMTTAAGRIDRVRRRQDEPDGLDEVVATGFGGLANLRSQAAALAPPRELAGLHVRLVEEIERAVRALEMVEHGAHQMSATAGRPRELEGETSIKRGYLNLLHAREALVTLAVDLRSGRVDTARWLTDRARGV